MEILSPQPNRRRRRGIDEDLRNIDATPASIIAPLTNRSRIVKGRKAVAKQRLSPDRRNRRGESERGDCLGTEADASKNDDEQLEGTNEGFIVDFVDDRSRIRTAGGRISSSSSSSKSSTSSTSSTSGGASGFGAVDDAVAVLARLADFRTGDGRASSNISSTTASKG